MILSYQGVTDAYKIPPLSRHSHTIRFRTLIYLYFAESHEISCRLAAANQKSLL